MRPVFRDLANPELLKKCLHGGTQNPNESVNNEELLDHVIGRLEPQLLDYVEVRHQQTTSNLLQIIDKYEERFLTRSRCSSPEFRDENQNVGNRLPNWNRQENWRKTRGNNRYSDNSRPQREFNRAMITNVFIPELNNHDVQELWFQQDGSICHTARARIDLLKDTFGERLISRFVPVHWPPRSCDLTPLDYFLWGYVKSLVYANKPQTLENLEDNIRRVIADIRPQMLEKVIENWTSRLDYIRASRGSPMSEIIFKM
ncbi:putative DD41D transposase [Trichonephila clavipes]|nr:putative DD41D transposase [Trichonephila clavipes]